MSEEPTLVCVRACQGWDLAQIYKGKLEAAEIPVLLQYESAGLIFGLTVDGLGCRVRPVPVALHDVRPAQADFAPLPRRQFLVIRPDDARVTVDRRLAR